MAGIHVEGLRKSDPVTLSVLAQDLMRLPLIELDPRSVCDLIALSMSDSLPVQLTTDLSGFRAQMLREISDLLDGDVLLAWLAELSTVDVNRVPEPIRDSIKDKLEISEKRDCADKLKELVKCFDEAGSDAVEVLSTSVIEVERGRSQTVPDSRYHGKTAPFAEKPVKAKRTPGRKAIPKVKTEEQKERDTWIEADIVENLTNYFGKGLKQSILIAGVRKRAPWSDVKFPEVVSALKSLKERQLVKFSAGRWLI
jgi:hypothetical protein